MELERATNDRHHEWRTPVLATVAQDGTPDARTVVLRQADAKQLQLKVFTDSRSPKVHALTLQPAATLVFWSKRLSWQLRISARIDIQTTGQQVDTAWARISQSAAAADYLSLNAPGDELTAAQANPGDAKPQHHLAILTATVQEIDWLELRGEGHRRASFGKDTWRWRVP